MKIYCPKCAWEPPPSASWKCGPIGCGFVWNTFQTHGQCPSCFKQWRETQCLECRVWSPHEDWYHDELPVEEERREKSAAA
jgi:hypothetical protein